MACAVSTDTATRPFELDGAWQLHPQVSIRPERFGALLYHFGTRQLSFLKSPLLLAVVTSLDGAPSARDACVAAGVPAADLASYRAALATLAGSQMIRPRSAR
ncbi:MAG: mycofactocin biosynthesis chaperone MftB [Actinomycetota bacterium]|nr:mycofactocin biosynthesis chaperone MftB [Actinomycetota bacterium]